MTTRGIGMVLLSALLASPLAAQESAKQFATRRGADTPLGQMSAAFQAIAGRVNASVVHIVAVGYRPLDEDERDGVSARRTSGASGVIISSDGHIVTNAHVVLGSQRLQVVLSPQLEWGVKRESILKPAVRTAPAEVVGLDFETDLAVLKISEKALPALPFGDSDKLAPGQIVLAFGSPLGLEQSVTMGVVSSPARQLEPESPMIYIQTDAPINPGNSGGPLVNTDGEIVGINTMIYSQSGGSEGVGFAVPSNIAANVVRHIREKGRMARGEIGVNAQTITPTLAAALRLGRSFGVILGDVYPEGPAARAGLRAGDIVASLDGKPMENARQFKVNLYRPAVGEMVRLEVLRGRETMTVPVRVVERPNDPGRFASLLTAARNKIEPLGVFVYDLSPEVRELLPPLRKGLGVVVGSRTADAPYLAESLRSGDVIYAVNQEPVTTLEDLRAALAKVQPGSPVALHVERGGLLQYLAFDMP